MVTLSEKCDWHVHFMSVPVWPFETPYRHHDSEQYFLNSSLVWIVLEQPWSEMLFPSDLKGYGKVGSFHSCRFLFSLFQAGAGTLELRSLAWESAPMSRAPLLALLSSSWLLARSVITCASFNVLFLGVWVAIYSMFVSWHFLFNTKSNWTFSAFWSSSLFLKQKKKVKNNIIWEVSLKWRGNMWHCGSEMKIELWVDLTYLLKYLCHKLLITWKFDYLLR